MGDEGRPEGRAAVRQALIRATIETFVEEGMSVSVRSIAARANVNHGLVHQYFGSKNQLLEEAFATVSQQAMDDLDGDGLPPADLVWRRNGEIPKMLARFFFELGPDANPIGASGLLRSWRDALVRLGVADDDADAADRVLMAASAAIGWSLFREYLLGGLATPLEERDALTDRVNQRIADVGGLPAGGDGADTVHP
ncbi:MAG: TetR/AcrR family transcriptional regulator [Ilumatobacteraceae bacterium]